MATVPRLPVINARPLSGKDMALLNMRGRGSGVIDPTRTATDPAKVHALARQFMGPLSQDLTEELQPYKPTTLKGAVDLAALFFPGHIGDRPALSASARYPQRVFRTEDLYPALAFRHAGGTAGLERDITRGQGLHTPIEIDWDPVHGVATVIQGNHRLIAANNTQHPYMPGTLGMLYGDLPRWLAYLKTDPNRKPYHEYGHINTGQAGQELIDRLLSPNTYAHPETGGSFNYKRDMNPADWQALIDALGLPNVKVNPGTTVEQAAHMFKPPYQPGG